MASDSAASHDMICRTETASEALFVCADDSCGRRVVVGKSRPGLTVLVQGDFAVRHVGGTGGVAMGDAVV
jgi:hypothetical protein